MGTGRSGGLFRKLAERYSGYDVYDLDGDKIGSVDATYVNESNQREYIAVSGGLSGLIPGTTGSNLIPVDLCTVDNNRRSIEVSRQKDAVKNAPSLGGTTDLTPEYEAQVRSYYRL
ncbi:MAG: PRC-barrel domain-containing protein [Actinomycetota bacterium]|nr:PRC-barrel domain-containing protein [Actinomycetota bacterium]